MMEQYINKSAVVAEIERIKKEECPIDTYEGRMKLFYFERFLSFIDTLETKEVETSIVPEYSYFEHIYHCGSEPRWKIGDVLAVYNFYSDREGEYVYGKITDVKMDKDEDWLYTFELGEVEYENVLLMDESMKFRINYMT